MYRITSYNVCYTKLLRVDLALPWTRQQIDEATRAVVKANGLSEGYVRPIAWPDTGCRL